MQIACIEKISNQNHEQLIFKTQECLNLKDMHAILNIVCMAYKEFLLHDLSDNSGLSKDALEKFNQSPASLHACDMTSDHANAMYMINQSCHLINLLNDKFFGKSLGHNFIVKNG